MEILFSNDAVKLVYNENTVLKSKKRKEMASLT